MAHPKSKISKQRKRKRRTHQKIDAPQITFCQTTGQPHLYHRAYWDQEGNLYYKGKLVIAAREEA
ncbi:MAG: 50S ribosomal protein L32 [Bacteroidota bacterium]